jgi:pimeloyl-ACP methyl ester carboxylesterase
MKPRIIFIHGNQTDHWSFGWASWLKNELERLGFETFFETMPDSIIARSEYWLPFMKDHIGIDKNDVIIGWSSGAVAAMRYAEEHQIAGSILVSPSYTDLGDDFEKQSGYFNEPWDWGAIRANQKKIAIIWGDDDPYIPQSEFAHINEQLAPDAQIEIPEGEHFVERHDFPELLAYIQTTYLPDPQN